MSSFIAYVSCSESKEIHSFRMDAHSGRLARLAVDLVSAAGAPSRGNMPLAVSRSRKVLYAQVRTDPNPLSAYAILPETGRLRLLGSVDLPAPMAYISTTADDRYLLSASYNNGLVCVSRIQPDGTVATPVMQNLQTPPKAHCIVQAPFGGFVYATTVDGNAVLGYRFDQATGQLLPSGEALACRAGAGPRHLAFHPTLDVLYCINEHAGSLSAYSVDRVTGGLSEIQEQSLMPAGSYGNAMGSDIHLTPDGEFVFASVRTTNTVSGFRIVAPTGRFSHCGTFEVESFPRGFAIDPAGRYMLCAGQKSHSIGVYAIDAAAGRLSCVERYPVGQQPSWIEIIPAA